MRIRKNMSSRLCTVIAGGAALTTLFACASLPRLEDARTVSVTTGFHAYADIAVDVDGNPAYRPGKMAKDAAGAALECGMVHWILILVCEAVMVPASAATGAVITAVSTLPEEQALELNRVSVASVAGINFSREFGMAVRREASRRGLLLRRNNADAHVRIVMRAMWWDVTAGNNVSIRIDFEVSGQVDGKAGTRKIGFRGERATAAEWIADDGHKVREALDTVLDDASQQIWAEVLGYEGD